MNIKVAAFTVSEKSSNIHAGFKSCFDLRGLTGIIVGCVIGGLVLIAIVVAVCDCIQKKKGAAGRVVHPAGYNAGATVVSK